MRYTSFKVKNFKGIQEASINLAASPRSRMYTLVGLNESGKTTFLEAINYFRYGSESLDHLELRGYARPTADEIIPISLRANFNGKISLEAGLHVSKSDIKALKSYLRITHKLKSIEIADELSLTIIEQYEFDGSVSTSSTPSMYWNGLDFSAKKGQQRKSRDIESKSEEWQAAVNFLARRLPRIHYFPNFLFDFPSRIYLEEKETGKAAVSQKHAFYRNIMANILKSHDENANLQDHLVDRIGSEVAAKQRALRELLLQISRTVTKRVFGAWENVLGKDPSGRRILVEADKDDDGSPYVNFRIEDTDGFFDIADRSLGFRWFFVYLLITSYRTNACEDREETDEVIYLFDEPASNLHPSAQQELLKSLAELSRKAPILYTTHSHHLIDPSRLESTLIVRNTAVDYTAGLSGSEAGVTNVTVTPYRKFANDNPSEVSYFQPILDVLDYRPSKLELVSPVLMTEGKCDFYVLVYLSRALGSEFESRVSFLPGTGSGTLDAPIQLYLGWARPFLVMLDSDAAGRVGRDRYLKIFGPIMEERVSTLSQLGGDSDLKAIESLISTEDRLLIQEGLNGTGKKFNKKKFHHSIQTGVATNRFIELGEETQASFLALIAEVHDRLKEQNGRSEKGVTTL